MVDLPTRRYSRCEVLRRYLVLKSGEISWADSTDRVILDSAKRMGIPV